MKTDKTQMETEIADLEVLVGCATFPLSLEGFWKDELRKRPNNTDEQKAECYKKAYHTWLNLLRSIDTERQCGSSLWKKMQAWD